MAQRESFVLVSKEEDLNRRQGTRTRNENENEERERERERGTTSRPAGLHWNLGTERILSGRCVILIRYLTELSTGRLILWCYFVWYAVVLVRYFDPNPRIWLTSLGLSFIIGIALFISTSHAGSRKVQLERWQTFRLFLMPFCVSSFSALVKGRGFMLIFSPNPKEISVALGLCAALCCLVLVLKKRSLRLPQRFEQ